MEGPLYEYTDDKVCLCVNLWLVRLDVPPGWNLSESV